MDGQYSLFAIKDKYRFRRYIGQKVCFWRDNIIGTVTEIYPYYTIIHDEINHRVLAGTPTTICPVNEEEKDGRTEDDNRPDS